MGKHIDDTCVGPVELCNGIKEGIYKMGAMFETEKDLITDMQVVGRDCYMLKNNQIGEVVLEHMPKDIDNRKGDYKGMVKPEHLKPYAVFKVVAFESTIIPKSE